MSDLRPALGVIVVAFMIGATTGPLLAVLIEGATGLRPSVALCAVVVPGLLMLKANRQTNRTRQETPT